MNKVIIFFILLGTFFVGCKDSGSFLIGNATQVDMAKSVHDVKLPTALWDKFDNIYMDSFSKEELLTGIERQVKPLRIYVYLREKTEGILSGDKILEFGPGGGTLDLAKFREVKKSGSYYLGVSIAEAIEDFSWDDVKIFHLSNVNKVKLASIEFGGGCSKYFDITSYFSKHMKSDGILVNNTDHRDFRLLGGSFFFIYPKGGILQIAQLTITDSGKLDILCRR